MKCTPLKHACAAVALGHACREEQKRPQQVAVNETRALFSFAACFGRVAAPNGPNTKEIVTTVTPHSPSISGLPHDRPSSVARQQRKKSDPRPPQAAGALKIALLRVLGAHGEHDVVPAQVMGCQLT